MQSWSVTRITRKTSAMFFLHEPHRLLQLLHHRPRLLRLLRRVLLLRSHIIILLLCLYQIIIHLFLLLSGAQLRRHFTLILQIDALVSSSHPFYLQRSSSIKKKFNLSLRHADIPFVHELHQELYNVQGHVVEEDHWLLPWGQVGENLSEITS